MSSVATLGVDDVATHAVMLLDRVRMDAYVEAIQRVVRPGDVVVDVGSGSGILAALAAKAGARKVYAIERGAVAQLARKVIDDNGLGDIVEVMRVDAREVQLPEPPTVLLSETLGCLGIDENMLALYVMLARQCAPGFRVMPTRVEPLVALVSDTALSGELGAMTDVGGVSLRALRRPLANRVLPCVLRAADLASEPGSLGSFTPGVDLLPRVLTAKLVASRKAEVNAVGGWFQADLCEGVAIDAGPRSAPTHWSHLLFPIDPPIACEAGDEVHVEIQPRVLTDRAFWGWTVRRGSDERRGDALSGVLGDARDVAAQLGAAGHSESPTMRSKLEAFRAALSGDGPLEPQAMAAQLFAAWPGRYSDVSDASQEIWALLSAAKGSSV
jgi:hypothetical protein